MAFNVSYVFSAVDKFSAPLAKAEKAVEKLDKSTREVNKTNSKVSSLAGGVVGKIGALAGAYVSLESAIAAMQKFAEFEKGLLELSAITGATGADLKRLEKSAFVLGKTFAKTGVETLDAFKLVASAKPELLENIPALEQVTKEVMKLSVASGIVLATASQYTAQSLNIFGVGADQAARFVNVLAAESKLGASEVAETGEAMLKAGPSAKVAGLSFEQTAAAIEMLALNGLKGSEAGNALNTMLTRLQIRGSNFKKESLDVAFGKIKSKLDAIKDPAERAAAAADYFGVEHLKAGEMLLASVGKMDAYTKAITGTAIADEQFRIVSQGVEFRAKALGVAFEEKLITVMNKLRPAFDYVVLGLEFLMQYMTPDAIEGFVAVLKVVGVVLGVIAVAVGAVIAAILVLLDLIAKIGQAIGAVAAKIMSGGKLELFSELKSIFSWGDKGESTQATIDVNINDKGGNVGAVKSQSSGNAEVNVGKNMAGAGA